MSTSRLEVIHYPERNSDFSKSVDLKIGQKTIMTPNFSIRLKNSEELDLLLNMKSKYSPSFISSYVVRLLDTPRTLYSKIRAMPQRSLFGNALEEPFSSSSSAIIHTGGRIGVAFSPSPYNISSFLARRRISIACFSRYFITKLARSVLGLF